MSASGQQADNEYMQRLKSQQEGSQASVHGQNPALDGRMGAVGGQA